jgi:hypothetical protein
MRRDATAAELAGDLADDAALPGELPPSRAGGRRSGAAGTCGCGRSTGTIPSVLEQIGGLRGFVYSTIPVLVFVTANTFLALPLHTVRMDTAEARPGMNAL